MIELRAGTRQGKRDRRRRGRCPDFLPPPPRPSQQEKFSRQGQACPPSPGGASLAAPEPAARTRVRGAEGKGIGPGAARPHNLAPGRPGPPPWHRPRLSPFLPLRLPRPGGGAHWARGRTDRAGVSSQRESASPAPRHPFLSPPGPGLRRRVQGAGAGGARRRKRRTRGRSAERSPLQLQPRVPSLLPAPKTRRWRRQLRKEAPVPQRHSALLHRPPRAEGDSRGWAAAGSIGARTPESSSSWPRPVPTRRAEGRAPRSPITARRPPGPPRSTSLGWETSDGRGDPGGGLLASRPPAGVEAHKGLQTTAVCVPQS